VDLRGGYRTADGAGRGKDPMTRRHILSQRQMSMIRIKICADCGDYAQACYDLEGEHVTDYCKKHMREHGFCPSCFNELTDAERTRGVGTMCDACGQRMQRAYNEYYDDDGDFE
jgi:hypothetical protein